MTSALRRDSSPRARALALLAACALGAGCSTGPGRYAKARLLDIGDVFPVSAAIGYGAAGDLRITPYLGLGLGWANEWRAGFEEQRFGPLWWEKERGIPFIRYYRYMDYREHEVRLPGGDPYWNKETRRKRATSLLILPGMNRDGEIWFPFLPAYFSSVAWEWPAWSKWNLLNAEVGLFAGVVGLRAGISLLQFLDFLAGVASFDPAGDDPTNLPILWPDPAASPSFDPPEASKPAAAPPEEASDA